MKKFKIQDFLKPTINDIAKYIPGESFVSGKKNIMKLSSNESPFKIPKKIHSKVISMIEKTNLYPDGDSKELKRNK